jgi:hypothetical protein
VYPPLLYGVIAANPHVVVLALLVVAGTGAGLLPRSSKSSRSRRSWANAAGARSCWQPRP